MSPKTLFIQHQVNQIDFLSHLPKSYGAEIDLRSHPEIENGIYLEHDLWKNGCDLVDWLEEYKKQDLTGPILFNTKEDGLEETVRTLTSQYNINNYFFLDTTVPTFIKNYKKKFGFQFFLRISKFEELNFTLQFKDQVEWLWIDCFDAEPLLYHTYAQCKKHFKVCLVSPELHQGTLDLIPGFKNTLPDPDAICTKRPDLWINS